VPELIATPPLPGQAPLAGAGVVLSPADFGPVTSIAPNDGSARALARALKPLGLGFPEPNRVLESGPARIVWSGRGQAFLLGVAPPAGLAAAAAVTDQSDGWAALSLTGAGAAAVLARLVPVDLRPTAFPAGAAARTLLNHLPVVVMRTGAVGIDLMVFRSMAATAWHEIAAAIAAVAARG
jgi:sarcosine oxidase subunit gamma